MAEDAWFGADAMLPPLRVRVRVWWAGRQFEAARAIHPKRKKAVWATITDGEIEYLPPKGRSRIWGDHPSLWQPLDVTTWGYPLPEPQPLSVPNWPRPDPVDNVSRETFHALDPLWWRDATQVGYSAQGEISRHEAEGRIMRALSTDGRLHVERPCYQSNADVLARLGQERLLVELDEPVHHDWRPPFQPLGADLDDYERAMAWFVALNPKEMWHKRRRLGDRNRAQLVLVYRAQDPPGSWDFIGRKWGVSAQRAHQIYQASLDKIERAANGRPVFKHVAVRDPMIEIRERNKRYAAQNSS